MLSATLTSFFFVVWRGEALLCSMPPPPSRSPTVKPAKLATRRKAYQRLTTLKELRFYPLWKTGRFFLQSANPDPHFFVAVVGELRGRRYFGVVTSGAELAELHRVGRITGESRRLSTAREALRSLSCEPANDPAECRYLAAVSRSDFGRARSGTHTPCAADPELDAAGAGVDFDADGVRACR